jgi:Ricin-type beta-trefoil lectin domain-like
VNFTRRRFFGLSLAVSAAATMLGDIVLAPVARAFGPSLLYAGAAPPSDVPQKYGCLYPKTTECTDGSLLATFEQPAALPVFPIYRSTNNGATWTRVSSVADTVNGWGNRCCAFLYTLPAAVGNLAAGTVLCAGISAPLDDSATYLELYASADKGSTWKFVSTIAKGGSYSTTAIWEPNLLLANGTLICYYSDSRDSAHSQKLSLQYSTNGVTWSAQQNVVALSPETLRPGMPVVSRLANGNYFLTYEVVNEASNTPTYFQISSNPLSWNSTSIGTLIGSGGSPYNTVLPDGTLLFNDYGSGNVLINTGNGAGSWTSVITPIGAGYSRTLQYVSGTGRVLIMSCAGFWEGVVNSIYYADQDFGESAGAYYQLVNRNSGMVLGVNGGSLANGTQLVQWANTGAADQAWHVTTTSGITKFGNRNSGQVLGIWQGGTSNGNDAVQWLDTGTADQQWTLVADGSYYKIKNVNSGLLLSVLGGSTTEGADIVQWADVGSLDQQWSLAELS